RANNSQIAAIAIAESRRHRIEQLGDSFARHQVSPRPTPCGKITALAESDHLLDLRPHGFCLGQSRLDALLDNERSHQVPQQGAAVRCVTAKFPSCFFVTHGKTPVQFRVPASSFERFMMTFPSPPET